MTANSWNALSGAALGTLVALLIALSTAPVVATTLSVLVGAAVVFLTLNDKLSPGRAGAMTTNVLVRILAFSIAGVVTLLVGLHLRASNALGDSPLVLHYHALIEIGFAEEDARLKAERFFANTYRPGTSSDERLVHQTVLFASPTTHSCYRMSPQSFGNIGSIRASYTTERGVWQQALDSLDAVLEQNPTTHEVSFLVGMHTALCHMR